MESLKKILTSQLDIKDIDWEKIEKRFTFSECEKGSIITKHNQVETKLLFLTKGIVRLYFETDEKEITLNFGFPDSFINSYSSFLTGKPSEYILGTLTSCEYYSITKDGLYELYVETDCGQALGRIFAERLFLYVSKRESDFMLKSPTQRYLDMFEEQPHLIQEIPQKYLASYIGITPQALSRIRSKI